METYGLDLKDKKILVELELNSRRSNNQIAKKVNLSKEVVKYRIDRLLEKGVILRFNTIINYFKLGYSKYKLYLRFTNIDKNKLEEIGKYFNSHKNTEWVALTTGRWDLITSFIVHNVNEFDDEIQFFLNQFSVFIQEKAVTTTLYLVHETRGFLSSENKAINRKIVYHTSKDKTEKIDKLDEEILKIITNNARTPITEIAKIAKTTPRIIQYHLKDLEKKKIILTYKSHLEPKAIGRIFCKLIIYLSNPTEKRLNSFIGYCSKIPGVVWPQRVMGAWDFELDLELNDYDEFQKIILEIKEKYSDIIKNHEFCIVSKEFKLDFFPECYKTL